MEAGVTRLRAPKLHFKSVASLPRRRVASRRVAPLAPEALSALHWTVCTNYVTPVNGAMLVAPDKCRTAPLHDCIHRE